MTSALIGHTGFVGSNLNCQMKFDSRYNSGNISDIDGREFDSLICAGVPAVKWLANKEPDKDKAAIAGLVKHLLTIKVKQFVLVSTIDVYPSPVNVDENSEIDVAACHPYGRHRLELERLISERFDTHIIRLPGLFGTGLKKNVIYDLLNDNNVAQIDPCGVFQFYYLSRLANDIAISLKHGIRKLNISSEPISVSEIATICGRMTLEASLTASSGTTYDYRSIHADKFDGANGYLYSKQQVLADLRDFVQGWSAQQ